MFVRETRSIFQILLISLILFISTSRADNLDLLVGKKPSRLNLELSMFKETHDITCENGVPTQSNFFSWVDYIVLLIMLGVSCGIGVFYGFFGDKLVTSSDFLLGGSSIGTFPMAISLAASFITAIELLGNPAEMYMYGSQYWIICLAFIFVVPLTSKFYLPVYMKLKLTSSYEYFQLRFNSQTRYLASALYILQMVLYTSVAVYAPALALSHETGLNVYLAVTMVYVVCIFYASQGGMKAVIMTDIFQACVLLGSLILIVFLGEKMVGGTGVIWSQNYNTERLEIFNMNPDPTIRHSFWSVVIGGTFYWLTMFCSNQASIQKYLSVESISQVRSALWTSGIGLILVFTLNFYTGMIMVAKYRDCDPIQSGQLSSSDEILPLFIVSEMGHLKGMTGFFIAGIFAASLGTVASALNSLTAVTQQDFIEGLLGLKLKESRGAFWGKCISISYGLISFALVFIVEQMGNIMTIALTFNGMVGGITLGLFSLGMFFPWANSKGAIFGALSSLALVMWMGLGQQVAKMGGYYTIEVKPLDIDNCPCMNSTASLLPEASHDNEDLFFLYKISYLWYSVIGVLGTIIIGLAVSYITGPQDPSDVNEDLISPPLRQFYSTLPIKAKQFFKLEQLSTNKQSKYNSNLKGEVNHTISILDEVYVKSDTPMKPKQVTILQDSKKQRKISAP